MHGKTHMRVLRKLAFAAAAALLASAVSATEPQAPGKPRDRVLEQARAALGTPYRYGGRGDGAFDCSGLVRWIYAAVGLELPHSTEEMLGLGTRISLDEALPGDLLVYDWGAESRSRLHVAVLLPDKEVIHASPKYREVRAVSLDNPVWKGRLIAVIRLLPV